MKALVLLSFLLIFSSQLEGQGAANPIDAFNNPLLYWFQLEQDFPNGATDWVFRASTTKYPIGFNETASTGTLTAALDPVHLQNKYDAAGISPGTCSPTSYEEWYIIVIPSNNILSITLNLTGNIGSSPAFSTLQYYKFNTLSDLNNIQNCVASTSGPGSIYGIPIVFGISQTSGTFNLNSTNLSGYKYLAIRIGNNAFPPFSIATFSQYFLSIYTNNSKCLNSLKVPISLLGFSSSTSKSLLNDLTEIPYAYYDAHNGSAVGNNDLNLTNGSSTGTNGMWFKVENIPNDVTNDPVYAAVCNVSPNNAQMVIYNTTNGLANGCPDLSVSSSDPADYIAGAEDQNTDLNANGGVDICLIGANSPNNPVIRLDNPYPSYYIYIFGDDGGSNFDFDFYFLNSGGTQNGGGGILPVEWLSFEGEAIDQKNQLIWSTASEQQNDYFVLEKSIDGENFLEFARVEGIGNSSFEQSYSYIDMDPYPLTYYRISQVDWDGTTRQGPSTYVYNSSTGASFRIIRNPVVTKQVNIAYQIANDEAFLVEIFDLNGRVLQSDQIKLNKEEFQYSIKLNELNNGLYLLSISNATHYFSDKMIVSNLN